MKSLGALCFLNSNDTESNFLNFEFFFILSERTAKINNKSGKFRHKNYSFANYHQNSKNSILYHRNSETNNNAPRDLN